MLSLAPLCKAFALPEMSERTTHQPHDGVYISFQISFHVVMETDLAVLYTLGTSAVALIP